METAQPTMEAMVQEITGVKVLCLHHDISIVTGEKIMLFTLTEAPAFREKTKKDKTSFADVAEGTTFFHCWFQSNDLSCATGVGS